MLDAGCRLAGVEIFVELFGFRDLARFGRDQRQLTTSVLHCGSCRTWRNSWFVDASTGRLVLDVVTARGTPPDGRGDALTSAPKRCGDCCLDAPCTVVGRVHDSSLLASQVQRTRGQIALSGNHLLLGLRCMWLRNWNLYIRTSSSSPTISYGGHGGHWGCTRVHAHGGPSFRTTLQHLYKNPQDRCARTR